MTKEQIFRSDRFFTKIENGEISTTEICEEQAFDQNIRKYYNSANYRDSVDARILISEQEHRIQELEKLCAEKEDLESTLRKFLNYARTGNGENTYVPNWQIEELATSLKSHQRLQPGLPHTNQDHFPPRSQEPLPLDSRTEF